MTGIFRAPGPFRALIADRGSAVGVLYVVWSIPLLIFMAVALNFGFATMMKAQLDNAADSAALLATTLATNTLQSGGSNAASTAITAGTQRFNTKAAGLTGVTVKTVNVNVVQSGTVMNATVQYSGTMQVILGGLVGLSQITLSGQAGANASVPPYSTVSVLMDVSSSMAIPATTAGITQMQNLTANYKAVTGDPDNAAQSCAFACHWKASGDYWAIAVANGVQLRLTVLQSAVTNLITQIAAYNQVSTTVNHYQIALYTFAKNFTQLFAPSTNTTAAATYVTSFSPDINLCANDTTCPETYFTTTMASLSALLPSGGDGSSAAKSLQYLFIITDGVIDDVVGSTRYVQALNPADCTAAKAKATVLVLYTPYYPILNNAYYVANVEPITPQIIPNLQACASSPSYYFVATDPTDINNQLQQMLLVVQSKSSHLTN